MKYMIDTHILLWWLDSPEKISLNARSIIENAENQIFVSAACIWEIVIKKSVGKLRAPDNLLELLEHENFSGLPIDIDHTMALAQLPLNHHDPFDRIQIAQSIFEESPLITRDKNILNYDFTFVKG